MLLRLPLAALVMIAALPSLRAQCIPNKERSPRTEAFSAVTEVRGAGPAGSEIELEEQQERVIATLRDYRGSPKPAETKLQGLLEETRMPGIASVTCRVKLSGRDDQGEVKVEGEITLARFRGQVTRYIGKEVFSYRISLKREMRQHEYSVGAL